VLTAPDDGAVVADAPGLEPEEQAVRLIARATPTTTTPHRRLETWTVGGAVGGSVWLGAVE
jgi:hypothetical protein